MLFIILYQSSVAITQGLQVYRLGNHCFVITGVNSPDTETILAKCE